MNQSKFWRVVATTIEGDEVAVNIHRDIVPRSGGADDRRQVAMAAVAADAKRMPEINPESVKVVPIFHFDPFR